MADPDDDDYDQTPEADRKTLAVLSDPFRYRAYECLRTLGDMKGRELASLVHVSEASILKHLRALQDIKFVSSDESIPARRRTWHAVPGGVRVDQDDSELSDAVAGWLGVAIATQASILRDWIELAETWPEEWRLATEHYDYVLHLTPQELKELSADLHGVMRQWRQLSRAREDRGETDGTEPVYVVTHAAPFPTELPPS